MEKKEKQMFCINNSTDNDITLVVARSVKGAVKKYMESLEFEGIGFKATASELESKTEILGEMFSIQWQNIPKLFY
jgi:hypothetical protein